MCTTTVIILNFKLEGTSISQRIIVLIFRFSESLRNRPNCNLLGDGIGWFFQILAWPWSKGDRPRSKWRWGSGKSELCVFHLKLNGRKLISHFNCCFSRACEKFSDSFKQSSIYGQSHRLRFLPTMDARWIAVEHRYTCEYNVVGFCETWIVFELLILNFAHNKLN